MTEILFYHLQGQKLEGVLTPLLEKSLARGWKAIVQGGSQERIEALDAHLWTYRDDGFLPHGTWREPEAADLCGARVREVVAVQVGCRQDVVLVGPGEDLLEHAVGNPVLDHHHPVGGLALVLGPEVVFTDKNNMVFIY